MLVSVSSTSILWLREAPLSLSKSLYQVVLAKLQSFFSLEKKSVHFESVNLDCNCFGDYKTFSISVFHHG